MTWVEQGEWLLIAPNQPVDARWSRHDRKALKALFTDCLDDGHLSLDGLANFIATRRFGLEEGIGSWTASFLDQDFLGYLVSNGSDNYRLYGLLTPAQRKAKTIQYGSLTNAQKAVLERIIYGESPQLGLALPKTEEMLRMSRSNPYMMMGDTALEPTNELPSGIPSNAVLTLMHDESIAVKQRVSNSDMGFSAFPGGPIDELASRRFFQQNPDLVSGDVGAIVWPNLFQPFRVSEVIFILEPSPNTRWLRRLADYAPIAPLGSYEQLPESFRKAIEEKIAAMNKQKAEGNPPRMSYFSGNGQRKNPPPK
jgi:hypothetical protein